MLYRLKDELTNRGFEPITAIMDSVGCNEKTACNKLNGTSGFFLHEAATVAKKCFDSSFDKWDTFVS